MNEFAIYFPLQHGKNLRVKNRRIVFLIKMVAGYNYWGTYPEGFNNVNRFIHELYDKSSLGWIDEI